MEGTIAEIRMFAGNFAPLSWALCQSQILSIAQNTALFSILGTTYGGNGQTTFALPDLQGRIPIGAGQGGGLSHYSLGQVSGSETNTILNSEFPAHNHALNGSITMMATAAAGDSDTPQSKYPATLAGTEMYSTANNGSGLGNMNTVLTAQPAGQASPNPVNNIQPVLGMYYIICMSGVYPARN